MPNILDTTRSEKIAFDGFDGWVESTNSGFKRDLAIVILAANVKRIKELLTPEELILIEIVSLVDFENLTPEILYKFEVLYRFIISL